MFCHLSETRLYWKKNSNYLNISVFLLGHIYSRLCLSLFNNFVSVSKTSLNGFNRKVNKHGKVQEPVYRKESER